MPHLGDNYFVLDAHKDNFVLDDETCPDLPVDCNGTTITLGTTLYIKHNRRLFKVTSLYYQYRYSCWIAGSGSGAISFPTSSFDVVVVDTDINATGIDACCLPPVMSKVSVPSYITVGEFFNKFTDTQPVSAGVISIRSTNDERHCDYDIDNEGESRELHIDQSFTVMHYKRPELAPSESFGQKKDGFIYDDFKSESILTIYSIEFQTLDPQGFNPKKRIDYIIYI